MWVCEWGCETFGCPVFRRLQHQLVEAIKQILALRVTVNLVEPQTLKRSEGKAKRVIDNRTT